MNILVSGVTVSKDGKKVAYISFDEGSRYAEAVIPDCIFIKNNGFSEDEIKQLTDYMKDNLEQLKKEAARINPLTAMMKEDK